MENIEAYLPLYENEINAIGYDFMVRKKLTAAVNVVKLNINYHYNSWNAFDNLAEAYFKQKNSKNRNCIIRDPSY